MMIAKQVCRVLALGLFAGLLVVLISQCSDTVAPAPPDEISIQSGNLQYSLRGTTLPDPLVVRVRTADGAVPEEAHVVFSVIEGGGTVASTTVRLDESGVASTAYTLGPDAGQDVIRAAIKENTSKSVVFEATAANFFCPEQEDTYRVDYETTHHLFIATRKSSLYPVVNTAGVVEIDVSLRTTSGFAEIGGGSVFDTNIYDAAFSARGDFYVARRSLQSEILKIDTSGNVSFFAHLDEDLPPTDLYAEITTNPSGLLVGCDAKGPFVVGCPDTLTRFDEATFPGADINSDAVAVDPRRQAEDPLLGEDIYFIDKTASSLMRLAMDSLAVELRGLETVAALTADQAEGARGMVCEAREGNVYILVDSEETKEIVQVTPAGVVTVLYDFFDRGAGDAAGVQRDLAYDESYKWLYTIDTLNNNLLIYNVGTDELYDPLFDDPLLQSTISTSGGSGERVGLVVLK